MPNFRHAKSTFSHSQPPPRGDCAVDPQITPADSETRYAINSLGFALNAAFPKQKASLGFNLFDEFADRSTCEGFSIQVQGAIALELRGSMMGCLVEHNILADHTPVSENYPRCSRPKGSLI
jgi:hypothetical protein